MVAMWLVSHMIAAHASSLQLTALHNASCCLAQSSYCNLDFGVECNYAVPTAGIDEYNNTKSFAMKDMISGHQAQLISAAMLVLFIPPAAMCNMAVNAVKFTCRCSLSQPQLAVMSSRQPCL